ncbi:IS30 family transposase [Acinetobacter sp. C_4_1]|uniref:IS30 family transposase n=1 Tax=unclassified Acinetobacter TaxID=196816 RepID=UPI0021B7616D|nr:MULTISPECIES: IS30 family transposase [unclassified Acinetobacter]MCT8089284.1 IS30 family transposase [Acinetobacter sp. F_3_1]MCT8096527.1 IS30 family transposase [Acinetobacter sp. C_3_1]MCT8100919.1 IS30 family transposase [Acinetobacter sp. C_4_1]MCT8134766.1 IS30 family transposase [Acinetobacter sp. T_3_1]
MNYTHLTQEERYQIYTLLREGFSKRYIAWRLNRSPSTISREIKRNRARNGYFAKHAHKLARRRHHSNPKRIPCDIWVQVIAYLELQWSPEQIASQVAVSLHSIYRFIQQDKSKGGVLFHNLRFRNQRKRKYGSIETRGQLTNRKSIHDRPAEIEQRSRFGDLEIDTIVGKNHQQSLVSIVDRKTGYLWLKKCSTRKAEEICQATIRLLEPIKEQLKTITADNGKEFSLHEYAAQELDVDWYFADPYSAWQRGTNENTNGLIRQYVRKGSDLNDYTDAYIAEITQRLNHRPRKRLGFKSPSQVLFQEHGVALQMLI